MPDSAATAARLSCAIESIRTFAWRHPEWWAVGLSAGASLVVMSGPWTASAGHDHGMMAISATPVADATLMVVAMMVPLALVPLRLTAFRSLWTRRHAAMAEYLLGYVGVWTFIMSAAVIAGMAMRPWL